MSGTRRIEGQLRWCACMLHGRDQYRRNVINDDEVVDRGNRGNLIDENN